MSVTISELISRELNIPARQVAGTVGLLDDGATIPFISRYRKEATGGLNEEDVQAIEQRLNYYHELEKRVPPSSRPSKPRKSSRPSWQHASVPVGMPPSSRTSTCPISPSARPAPRRHVN